jgi:hypothetical protein
VVRLAYPIVMASLLVGCGRWGFSGNGTVDIDHPSIDFTMVPCGSTSTMTVTLTDTGDKAVTFAIESDVPGVDVTPASGTLDPGASIAISVTAKADAIGIPGMAMTGELVISSDDPTVAPVSIPVSLTTAGGVVTTDQSTIDFGQVTTQTAHAKSVMLTNTGNTTLSLTAGPFADPAFTVTSPMTFELGAGASDAIALQFDPALSQAYSYQLPLTANGATCQAMPVVTTAGVGTLSTVLLDHTTIDFGAVACGSPGGAMVLTVTNGNAASYPYTASVTSGGSAFAVAPTSGTVPASGTTTMSVSHNAVGIPTVPGMVTGNLHVVVTGPPMGTSDVPLQYDVTGSALSADMMSVDFGQISTTSASRTVRITNSGNQVANVTVTRTGSSKFTAPSSFQVSPMAIKAMTITFSSTSTFVSTADFTLSAGNQCSVPIDIHTSGSGTGSGSGSGSDD